MTGHCLASSVLCSKCNKVWLREFGQTSPFENGAGNHNVAICGKSGSGKSVLLQEMCAALRGAGAQVVVIDDGRSFEHSARLQGGRFVEFTLASGFCLNPFSMIDAARAAEDEDYRLDCFGMVNTPKIPPHQIWLHGDGIGHMRTRITRNPLLSLEFLEECGRPWKLPDPRLVAEEGSRIIP